MADLIALLVVCGLITNASTRLADSSSPDQTAQTSPQQEAVGCAHGTIQSYLADYLTLIIIKS